MLDFFVIFLFFVYDGKKIVDIIKKGLEKNEIMVYSVDIL